jgi:hypothetical protein
MWVGNGGQASCPRGSPLVSPLAGWPLKADHGCADGSTIRNPVVGYLIVLLHIRFRNWLGFYSAAHSIDTYRREGLHQTAAALHLVNAFGTLWTAC